MSLFVADFLFFSAFLYQFSPIKQETDDLAVLFRFIPQTLAVVPVRLAQLSRNAVCLCRKDTHLTVCSVVVVLLPAPLSLFLQQVPLSEGIYVFNKNYTEYRFVYLISLINHSLAVPSVTKH